jgi:hypothetical protein
MIGRGDYNMIQYHMSTAVIVGIVVLLGGVVGVFLYLRAQKRKETEEREEAERRAAIAEAEKEKAEFLRKQKAASDAEEMEKKIKAMKAESDAKIARLERSAREAEKRRMERPRRQETPAGTKDERRDFKMMLWMIATILFKPPPGISGGAPTDENIRKTKQVLATIRAGTADKETVKRWKSAWKLAKIKIRQRKEKRARQLARLRERQKRQKGQLRRRPRRCHPTFGCPKPKRWRKCPPGKLCRVRRFGNRSRFGGSPFCRQANPYARKNCERARRRRGKGFFRGKLKFKKLGQLDD